MEKKLIATKAWRVLDAVRAEKDETREVMMMICVTTEYIAATNGCILVTLPLEVMAATDPGTYEIHSAKKYDKTLTELVLERRDDVRYPEVEHVIPAELPTSAQVAPEIRLVPETGKGSAAINAMILTRAAIQLYQITGDAFNTCYLAALLPLGRAWTVHYKEEDKGRGKALLLTSHYDAGNRFRAIVLPFNLADDKK